MRTPEKPGGPDYMITRTWLLTVLFCLWTFAALGGDKPHKNSRQPSAVSYDFQTINDPGLVSINSRDEKSKRRNMQNGAVATIYVDRFGSEAVIQCGLLHDGQPDLTLPGKISEGGSVLGTCAEGDAATRAEVSFIHNRLGVLEVVVMAGMPYTQLYGINNKNQAVGMHTTPYVSGSGLSTIHGLVYDKGALHTLDIPGTDRYTQLFGIDDQGRIAGVFVDYNPATNATIGVPQAFLYDNGQLTMLNVGGKSTSPEDMNGLGQILLYTDNGLYLWDDGTAYAITAPGKFIGSVDSIDNNGRILGHYMDSPCTKPSCPFEQFLATPARLKMVDKR